MDHSRHWLTIFWTLILISNSELNTLYSTHWTCYCAVAHTLVHFWFMFRVPLNVQLLNCGQGLLWTELVTEEWLYINIGDYGGPAPGGGNFGETLWRPSSCSTCELDKSNKFMFTPGWGVWASICSCCGARVGEEVATCCALANVEDDWRTLKTLHTEACEAQVAGVGILLRLVYTQM